MSSKSDLSQMIRIEIYFKDQLLIDKVYKRGPIIFGRLSTSDIVLNYPFISKEHCQIVERNKKFYLEDLNSRNGFFVGGRKLNLIEITNSLDCQIDKLDVKVSVFDAKQESTAKSITKKNFSVSKYSEDTVIPTKIPSQASMRAQAAPTVSFKSITKEISYKPHVQELVGVHPGVEISKNRRLEAVVTWHDQVYDVKEFDPMERVTIGPSVLAEIRLPVLNKNWSLAHVDFESAKVSLLREQNFNLTSKMKTTGKDELIAQKSAVPRGSKFNVTMKSNEVLDVDLGSGLKIYLRYIPATQSLTTKKLSEPDQAFKQALVGSALIHALVSIALVVLAPQPKNVPKLKNVPERYARLLVEPPKPILPVEIPTPPPTPPPEPEKQVVQTRPEIKKPEIRKQKPITKIEKIPSKKFELPKKLVQKNQFPIVARKSSPVESAQPAPPTPPAAKPVKVESLGALAALGMGGGAIADTPVPANIQINKNAGGKVSNNFNTSSIANPLPSANGKLVAMGSPGPIKTKGQGVGSGTEYGTQGLKGSAGSRGVAAAVVGKPNLVSSGKPEGLTRDQVMKVVNAKLSEIQHCYEKSLLSNANLAGRMEFEWDISAQGSVGDVRMKKSTVNGGGELSECVKSVFRSMNFPKAKNGQSTTPNIGFPFGRI